MNKKPAEFEKTVVRLFLTEKMNRSEICRTLKCSMFAVNRILNDHKIDPVSNKISSYDKHYGEILQYFNATNDLCKTLRKFNRYKSVVYDICSIKDLKVDDALIIDLFITVDSVNQTKCIAKSTINYFTRQCNDNVFLKRTIDYLISRYSDSESISETIARIYNNLDVRPVCKQCGRHLNYYSLNEPFPLFCSKACSNNNEDTKLHLKQTCLKKYGVTNSAKAECVKRKYRDRMEQTYGKGITNAFQSGIVIKKSEDTKLSRYGSKTYNNRVKAEQTCLDKYGVSVSSQDPGVKDKIVNSQYMTFIDRYRAKRPFQNPEVFHEFQESMLKKFGSTCYLNSVNFQEQCMEKYGCRNPMQNPDIRRKQQHRYTYNGIAFDSAPEIAFYIWLNDVKNILDIDFEYSPNIKFKYDFAGKTHFYMPDFCVGNQYFEIKGNHFFKPDGTMFNPFRDPLWSDIEYEVECRKYEAKHQCMLRNKVLVLKNAEYGFFVSYVEETYGKAFLHNCKNAKTVNL